MSDAAKVGLDEIYKVLLEEKSKTNREDLEYFPRRAIELGSSRVIPVNPDKDIIFQERVRVICVNNCFHYGFKLSCPPYIPNLNYEKAIKEYEVGFIIILDKEFENEDEFQVKRVESSNTLHRILLKMEKEAFNMGYYLTIFFTAGSCKLCYPKDCPPFSEGCRNPQLFRIPLEATGVNVVETLKKFGINLNFPVNKYKKFSRVGLFLPAKSADQSPPID